MDDGETVNTTGRAAYMGGIALVLVGTALAAKPFWFGLPWFLLLPYVAVALVVAGFLLTRDVRGALIALAGVALAGFLMSVLWYTVASPLWLPALAAEYKDLVPPGTITADQSLVQLALEGAIAGFSVALLSAGFFAIGAGAALLKLKAAANANPPIDDAVVRSSN